MPFITVADFYLGGLAGWLYLACHHFLSVDFIVKLRTLDIANVSEYFLTAPEAGFEEISMKCRNKWQVFSRFDPEVANGLEWS